MNENNERVSRQKMRHTNNSEQYRRRKAIRRKNRRKTNLLLASVLGFSVIVIVLIVALIPQKSKQLLGVWQYDQYTEYEFLDNGEGCLCVDDVHYEYQYKILGDKLRIDFIEDIVRDCEYSFIIDGNTLTLNGKEGTDGGTYTLKKHQ